MCIFSSVVYKDTCLPRVVDKCIQRKKRSPSWSDISPVRIKSLIETTGENEDQLPKDPRKALRMSALSWFLLSQLFTAATVSRLSPKARTHRILNNKVLYMVETETWIGRQWPWSVVAIFAFAWSRLSKSSSNLERRAWPGKTGPGIPEPGRVKSPHSGRHEIGCSLTLPRLPNDY